MTATQKPINIYKWLDADYFNAGVARVIQSQAQDNLFSPIQPAIKPEQCGMFK